MTRPQGPQIQQNIIIRHDRISHPAMQTLRSRVLAGTLALTIAGGVLVGSPVLVGAQDGTGGATPTVDTTCNVPTASWDASATPPPTSASTSKPTVTPAARDSSTPLASPDASPVASPVVTATTVPTEVVTPTPDATSAPDALTDDLTAAANAITECLSAGDAETLVSVTSDAFRGQLIGSDQPISADNYITLSASLSVLPYSLVSLTDATATGDDTASAIVTYTVGKQIRSGEWSFQLGTVDGNPVWILNGEAPQTPETPANVATVDVTIEKDAYDFSSDTLSASDVAFAIANKDDRDHELFVVKLATGTDVSSLLTNPGPGLPNGVTFVGQVTIPAGSEGTMLLADLAPGTYTVVDLLPDDEGVPHLSKGMQTTFTVK